MVLLAAFPWFLVPDPNLHLLQHDLLGDHACSWSSNHFGPHRSFALSIFSRMSNARSLGRLIVNRSLWRIVRCNTQRDCKHSCVCDASVSAALGVLKSLDACSSQAEAVTPTRIKMGFGCNGLGLFRSGSSRSVSSVLSPSFVRLTLVSTASPSWPSSSGCCRT